MSYKKKSNVLATIGIILAVVLVAGLAIALFAGNAGYKWQVGTLDENGKFVKSEYNIVSKEFSKIEDLEEIEVETDANFTYTIFFYDEDEKYLTNLGFGAGTSFDKTSIEGSLVENPTAELFKIVLTPNEVNGEKIKVDNSNIEDYTSQMTITFNEE